MIGVLLALCWLATYAGGGAGKVPPHFFYAPIMVAASRFGFLGAAVAALVSGILAGPLMPLDVRTDTPQALLDWGSRTGFFLGIGLLMAGIISRRNRAERDRTKREAELEALRAIDLSILGVAPFEETVSIAQEGLGRLMRVDRLGLIILDGDRAWIRQYWVSRGGEAHEAEQSLPAEGPLARALRSGEVASGIVEPTGSDWEGELAAEGLRSYLVVPLVAASEVVGALAASSRRDAPFPMGEVDTAGRVAAQLAVALRLRESEQRYRTLFDHMPVGLFRTSPEGRILDANQALVQMLGYPDLGSLLSINARALYPDPEARTSWQDQRRASGTSSLEMQQRRYDGSLIWVRDTSRVVRDERGRPQYYEGSMQDITLQRLAQTELEETLQALQRTDQSRRQLLEKLVEAQEEERKRIAADIHDDSIQSIAALGLRLASLERILSEPTERQAVADLQRVVERSVASLRHLMFELRPPALDREGLSAAVKARLEMAGAEGGFEYSFENRLSSEPPSELRAIVYRIAQEALVNIQKHAHAKHVSIDLEEREGGVQVRITDDGIGLGDGEEVPGHLGLATMRERAQIAGGWTRIENRSEGGVAVEAWVPVSPAYASKR